MSSSVCVLWSSLCWSKPRGKKEAYGADITYGTNNEFGFDYLRDNMAFSAGDRVQRPLNFAIVDEVDSILIDEARTPLIISGGVENSADIYRTITQLVPRLTQQLRTEEDVLEERIPPGDYFVDEKQRDIEITEEGHQKLEELAQAIWPFSGRGLALRYLESIAAS